MLAPLPDRRGGGVHPIRLMLVDDSIVARSVFQTMLAQYPEFTVVATAGNAEQALARLGEFAVDIVLLDLAMPGMDGLTALPEIIRQGNGAKVLVVSASAGVGADACVRALTLGAADTLEKPSAGSFGEAFRAGLVDKLRRIGAEGRVADREVRPALTRPVEPMPALQLQPRVAGRIGCLAIGASTGGLHALSALFAALPAEIDAPILITQHLPASFMPYFAAQMADIAKRKARVARDGERLVAGEILVAPGDAHIGLRSIGSQIRIQYSRNPAPSGCLPSVDPMFSAVAEHFGEHAFAVVLSGMGRDGAIGARDVIATGGEIAAQDRDSSVVWGMPGSVAKAGFAATVAHPAAIAARIAERIGGGLTRRAAWM
jgi:two-component system, chemotaxis family, protein-glutamate methylesterase/glutaminase